MKPIFIIGSPRSGTSMLHWALAQHQNLWGSAESDFLAEVASGAISGWQEGTNHGDLHWLNKEGVSREAFMAAAGSGIADLYLSRSGGLRWLDQTPANVFHYDALRLMFPGARFIHIMRNGRHAVDSMQVRFGWSFGRCLKTWKSHIETGIALSDAPDVLSMRYEKFSLDRDAAMDEVFSFIGETPAAECVSFLESPINTAPGREGESPEDKLSDDRINWGPLRSFAFKRRCGDLQARMERQFPVAG